MKCKCGARTYEGHLRKARTNRTAHVYSGPYWSPRRPRNAGN